VLEAQAQTRLPELVPIGHGRMLVSPFTFYRGTAALMAADLAATPRTPLHAQLCGDAHLSNFGGFAAPDRRLIFGLDDFDETLPGPFEWDVKRLVASFAIAGRDRGFDAEQREPINLVVGRSYREAMSAFAQMRALDLWYARLDVEELSKRLAARATPKQQKRFDRSVAKARTKDSLRASDRLTRVVDGRPRIVSDPPLIVPIEELLPAGERTGLEDTLRNVIRSYRRTLPSDRRHLLERFHYADAARKVVGVGSVGTRTWIVLMLGNDDGDPLFLQLKEAEPSVLEPYLGTSKFAQHGQRVVEGQRLMQAASDIMLGWFRTPAPATPSRSPPTSGRVPPSTAPWRRSPRTTPTRTSATTPRSATPSTLDGSRRKRVCNRRRNPYHRVNLIANSSERLEGRVDRVRAPVAIGVRACLCGSHGAGRLAP
jgi:uncharacterized protein (DUF2252 family)